MKWTRPGVVLAATLATVSLGAGTAAASPQPRAYGCGDGRICMWEDGDYQGSRYVDYLPGSNDGDRFELGGWNGDNEISSIRNESNKWIVLYDGDKQTGAYVCVWASTTNLKASHAFNDRAESFQLVDHNICA